MEALLRPDTGLMIWTVFNFAVLVFLLGNLAWKPLLKSLREREEHISAEKKAAEDARLAAEKIQADLADRFARIDDVAKAAIETAFAEGAQARDEIINEAKAGARAVVERAKKDMEEEKQRLVSEIRREVSELSVMAAERIIRKKIDIASQNELFDEFFRDVDKRKITG